MAFPTSGCGTRKLSQEVLEHGAYSSQNAFSDKIQQQIVHMGKDQARRSNRTGSMDSLDHFRLSPGPTTQVQRQINIPKMPEHKPAVKANSIYMNSKE